VISRMQVAERRRAVAEEAERVAAGAADGSEPERRAA
jgi:hypothetical protein